MQTAAIAFGCAMLAADVARILIQVAVLYLKATSIVLRMDRLQRNAATSLLNIATSKINRATAWPKQVQNMTVHRVNHFGRVMNWMQGTVVSLSQLQLSTAASELDCAIVDCETDGSKGISCTHLEAEGTLLALRKCQGARRCEAGNLVNNIVRMHDQPIWGGLAWL